MKNSNIQHLRGLACVMLVLYQMVGADPGRGLQLDGGPLRVLSDALAAVRMPLFALLAGAVYGLRPRSGINALFDKAHRLLLPVLTASTRIALQAMGIESLTLHLLCATLAGLYGPVLVERVLRDWPMGRSLLLGEPRRNAGPVPPPHVVPPTALPTPGV